LQDTVMSIAKVIKKRHSPLIDKKNGVPLCATFNIK